MVNIESKLKDGLLWTLAGKFANFFITFISNIILVRLLSPEDFGVFAIVLFFVLMINVLSESGMSGALIRKESVTEIDYSTLFIFNLAMSVVAYISIFFCANIIGDFYHKSNLVVVLQVVSFVVVINAFRIVQTTRLYREIKYKEVNLYQFLSIVFASLIAIFMAYMGYGIWALVLQQLVSSLIFTIILWLKGGGLKSFIFSKQSFLGMYEFGIYTTMASLLNTFFENIYQLILGKGFSLAQSGYYFQGKKIQELPLEFLKSVTLGVVFSTLSRLQSEKENFDKLYNKIHIFFSLVIAGGTLLLLIFSKEIVLLFFGEIWLGSSLYIQLLAIASFFYMQEMMNRVLFKVFDQAKAIFKLELVKKSIQLITILIGVYFSSIHILLYGLIFSNFLGYLISEIYSKKFYQSSEGKWKELKVSLYISLIIGVVFIFYNVILIVSGDYGFINLFYTPVILVVFLILSLCLNPIRRTLLDLFFERRLK